MAKHDGRGPRRRRHALAAAFTAFAAFAAFACAGAPEARVDAAVDAADEPRVDATDEPLNEPTETSGRALGLSDADADAAAEASPQTRPTREQLEILGRLGDAWVTAKDAAPAKDGSAPPGDALSAYGAYFGFGPGLAARGVDGPAGRVFLARLAARGERKGIALLIHGYRAHAGHFAPFAELLAGAGWDCYLVDLPGHGLSEGQRFGIGDFGDYGRATQAAIQAIRELEAKRGDVDSFTYDGDSLTYDDDTFSYDDDTFSYDGDSLTYDGDSFSYDDDSLTGDGDSLTGDGAASEDRRGRTPLVLIGHSTGCSAIIEAFRLSPAEEGPPPADGVVFAAPLVDMPNKRIRGALNAVAGERLLELPGFAASPALIGPGVACNPEYREFIARGDPLSDWVYHTSWLNSYLDWYDGLAENRPLVFAGPALVVQGTGDTVVNWRGSQELLDRMFPARDTRFYEGYSHTILNATPERLSRVFADVEAFLAELAPR